jgi:hydrogenase/urease accessory protein HupE
MIRLLQLLAIVLAANLTGNAFGHEVRPGYLELRQTGVETWSVLWKVPALGEMRLSIRPSFPENCTLGSESVTLKAAGAYIERMTIECKGGLVGRAVAIDGLAATMTDVLVRSVRADKSVQIARLTSSAAAFVFEDAPASLQVVRTYTMLGVEHILLGVDHLLFVLALLLLVAGWKKVVVTITAFTVAHSITLAAATFGLLKVAQAPVEAVIALSILFVAVEIVNAREGRESLTIRRPWLIAFCFGLLHGLGFAGALRDLGLPEQSIPLALLFFNLGVEIGQLLFIAAVLGTLHASRHLLQKTPSWAWRVPVYAIGTAASYWTIERVAGFWV